MKSFSTSSQGGGGAWHESTTGEDISIEKIFRIFLKKYFENFEDVRKYFRKNIFIVVWKRYLT